MLRPVLVIPLREVHVRPGFMRFFTNLSRKRLLRRLVDEVLQLKGLRQVGAPDPVAVRDSNLLALLPPI